MGLRLAAALVLALAAPAGAEVLRLATFSPDLTRRGPGLLLQDLGREDAQIAAVVAVIAEADADVLLLTGFDWDHEGRALAAFLARLEEAGTPYPHAIAGQPNSGLRSGLDLDGDGRLGGGEDAQGYGRFAGVRGIVLLSRRPMTLARDLTTLLWADLPDNLMPAVTPEVAAAQRLSSTAHWHVQLPVGGEVVHLLTLSATPPLFDRQGDRNARRNHDEVALWLQAAPPARWVVMGKINLDPEQGPGRREALQTLLARSADPQPQSEAGGPATVDWGPDQDGNPRRQRVDYLLPSPDITVLGSGVIWPSDGALADIVATASRHRLVWMDIAIP